MFLKRWDPVIKGRDLVSDRTVYSLELNVVLGCPVCATDNILQTWSSQHFFLHGLQKGTRQLEKFIERKVEQVKVQHACKKCGTISIVPDDDCTMLEVQAKDRITDKWFSMAIATLQSATLYQ